MAICKTDSSIESIRGRFGGVYFKKDSAGQHIQAMPRAIRKASMESPVTYASSPGGSRAAYIQGWSALSSLWGLAYAAGVCVAWAAFAVVTTFVIKSGATKHISNWNWFTHFNMDRFIHKKNPYWKPPPTPDIVPPIVLVLDGSEVYSKPPPLPSDEPTDYYWAAWWYNEKRSYESDSKEWIIWWTGAGWVCSHILGSLEGKHYVKSGDSPYGDYIEADVPAPRTATATK